MDTKLKPNCHPGLSDSENNYMKIVIVGGHLAPALAVIEALPKDTKILFIGRKYALEGDKAYSLEYQTVISLNIPFINLETGRLQRKFTKYTITSLLKLPLGFYQAFKVLSNYKPDCLVSFGGYLQIPLALAALFLRVPVITHEQTRKAGLANKIISPIATTICISWKESAKYFPSHKTILTGLPLRKEFFLHVTADNEILPNTPLKKEGIPFFHKGRLGGISDKTIYITGGSLGAHAINILVEGAIGKLLEKFYIIHQTGDAKEYNDYERLEKIKEKLSRKLGSKYKLVKFIDPGQIPQIIAASDIVISRSGINTVAELIYLQKPCLLIPLPYGQANEQLDNALFAQKLGLGKVLIQAELTPEMLYSQIVEFTAKLDKAKSSGREAKKLIKHDAAEKIFEIVKETVKQKNQQKE